MKSNPHLRYVKIPLEMILKLDQHWPESKHSSLTLRVSSDLQLQEWDVEEAMEVFETKAVSHGGLGIVDVGGARRSKMKKDYGIREKLADTWQTYIIHKSFAWYIWSHFNFKKKKKVISNTLFVCRLFMKDRSSQYFIKCLLFQIHVHKMINCFTWAKILYFSRSDNQGEDTFKVTMQLIC